MFLLSKSVSNVSEPKLSKIPLEAYFQNHHGVPSLVKKWIGQKACDTLTFL